MPPVFRFVGWVVGCAGDVDDEVGGSEFAEVVGASKQRSVSVSVFSLEFQRPRTMRLTGVV